MGELLKYYQIDVVKLSKNKKLSKAISDVAGSEFIVGAHTRETVK